MGMPGRVWESGKYEICPNTQNLDPAKFARNKAVKDRGIKGAVGVWKDGGVWEFFSVNEMTKDKGEKIAKNCP